MFLGSFQESTVVKYLALLGILLSVSHSAESATFQYTDMVGVWRVVAVTVNSDGMQALQDNDPAYMGAVVRFDPDKIAWIKGTTARPVDPATDDCDMPPRLSPAIARNTDTVFQVDGGFNVMCGEYGWGPTAVLLPGEGGAVSLYWHDNAILTLKREK